ncbi:hypothetical protein [Streptomyces umbrinus]|uniref:hypothetical protein n=1 Tax=Streptomyces umbrinus TaxID=67370 RepID=UPI0027D8188A|nr:hypothetical protein [Streptomyces umbrinus]
MRHLRLPLASLRGASRGVSGHGETDLALRRQGRLLRSRLPAALQERQEPFCYAHLHQQRVSGLSILDFVRRPGVVALPSFGICQVLACDREKDYERTPYCMAHRNRLSVETRNGRVADEETWRRTTSPVTITGEINLRGLPELLVAEIIFGLQERTRSGAKTKDHSLRPLCDTARRQQVGSITEIDLAGLTRLQCQLVATFTTSIDRLGATPETERLKDIWDLVVFGMGGHLRFSDISQPWLREAAKAWAVEELPQRRGKRAHHGPRRHQEPGEVLGEPSAAAGRSRDGPPAPGPVGHRRLSPPAGVPAAGGRLVRGRPLQADHQVPSGPAPHAFPGADRPRPAAGRAAR